MNDLAPFFHTNCGMARRHGYTRRGLVFTDMGVLLATSFSTLSSIFAALTEHFYTDDNFVMKHDSGSGDTRVRD